MSRSYQAGLYPNPTVGYTAEQIGAFGEVTPTPSGVTASRKRTPGELQGGFVQQEIVTGGKLRLSRAKFAEEATAARFQADAQRLRVVNGVRTRYFEVVAAERLIAINRDLSRLNDDAVKTTEQLVNVGQANEPDLLQAKVEARRARVALRNAENRYRGSWEGLVALVGAPELRPTHLDDSALDAPAAELDFDQTLANLLRCSPEIQAALAEIRRSQVMVRRERVEPIPNVTLQAVVGRNYEFNITTAGVQASIPLPVWNRNQGTIREAQSDLARDHAEHDRIALSLRQRLADAATRFEDARQSAEDFRTESLPLARRAYEVQAQSFRERRSAYPQVLVARRTMSRSARSMSNRSSSSGGPRSRSAACSSSTASPRRGLPRPRATSNRCRSPGKIRAISRNETAGDSKAHRLVPLSVSSGDGGASPRPHRPRACSPRAGPPLRPASPARRGREAARGRPSSTPRPRYTNRASCPGSPACR